MAIADPERLSQLAEDLHGALIRPGEDGYDQARSLWNGRFRRRPAVVVRCASDDDVARAVRFARTEGMEVSVKGGGHSYAGNTIIDDSLLIDLSLLGSIEVDAKARRATVGGGARWGGVDAATQKHGLATTGGTVSTVGVAGFTLGGGSGWLVRKHGLALDNLRGVRVVTADGRVVRADEDENPDLFWALRGGSGNFGVVTCFEYALYPVGPELLAGQVFYPVGGAPELLRLYRDYFLDAPEEVMCYPFFIRVPPIEPFPEAFHGQVALDFVVSYAGPLDEAEEHLAPFRNAGEPFLDLIAPQPYLTLQQSFDAGMGPGNRWYSRSQHLDELSDEAIDTLVDSLDPFPGELTAVYLGPHDGAIHRVAPGATAYAHRSSAHELHVFPGWTDSSRDAGIISWANAVHNAMRPHGNDRVYVNLLGDMEKERVPRAFAENYDRLRTIKAEWDPDNVFHGNHNIEPEG
ncbi:MAG: FAD-binding oxidoreductase [Longimicrobiales bacterium]|nr:FAD-binding oxidoreductase [Longimicrobiales bacterium]